MLIRTFVREDVAMASNTRKRQKAQEPVVEIDDSFNRVMARACLAAADQIQESSISQISVEWERGTPTEFEQSRRANRDDFGVVGEIHRKAIPEQRWRVEYNRLTATYRLEEIEEEPLKAAVEAPPRRPRATANAATAQPTASPPARRRAKKCA
jgi:hypothetical protein